MRLLRKVKALSHVYVEPPVEQDAGSVVPGVRDNLQRGCGRSIGEPRHENLLSVDPSSPGIGVKKVFFHLVQLYLSLTNCYNVGKFTCSAHKYQKIKKLDDKGADKKTDREKESYLVGV